MSIESEQPTFTCSKSLEKGVNMFKVKNENI